MDYTFVHNAAVKVVDNIRGISTRVAKAESGIVELQNASNIAVVTKSPFESHAGNFKINEIGGQSEQASYTGKNLLDCRGLTEQTIKGATFTPKYDKNGNLLYVEVNGTPTGNAFYYLKTDLNLSNGNYFLNGYPSATNIVGVEYYVADASAKTYGTNTSSDTVFTVADNGPFQVFIIVKSGCTVTNLRFYPMIRLTSVTDPAYEPYSGGKPSPSPDYPQEIKKTVVSEIKTHGKNFINIPSINTTHHGVVITNNNGTLTVKGTSTKDAGFNITLLNLKKGRYFTNSIVYRRDANGTWLETIQPNTAFEVIDESQQIVPLLWFVQDTSYDYTVTPMICLEKYKDGEEPYIESTIKLSKPVELYGIGDAQDKIVYNNGMWKIEREYYTYALDGTKNISRSPQERDNTTYRFYISDANTQSKIKKYANNEVADILSDMLIPTTGDRVYWSVEGISVASSGTFMLYHEKFKNYTVEQMKEFLSNTPINVVYRLAEPVIEDLPLLDQSALNSLKTYDNLTYVEFDSEVEPTFSGETALTEEGSYILSSMANNKESNLGDYVTTTETTLLNSHEGRLKVGEIGGKAEQVTTTGAQLLYFDGEQTGQYGVMFSRNSDGSIRIEGKSTSSGGMMLLGNAFTGEDVVLALKAGNYYVSGLPENIFFFLYKAHTESATTISVTSDGFFTLDTDTDFVSVSLRWTVIGYTFNVPSAKIMLNTGATALPWEPYTGGQPSPNPDYPQEIKKTVVSGIKTCGKNLFNFEPFYNNTGTNLDSTVNRNGDKVIINTTAKYYSGVYCVHSKMGLYENIRVTVSFDATISNGSYIYAGFGNVGNTFNMTPNVKRRISFTRYISTGALTIYSGEDVAKTITVENIQYELGDISTDYEPYTESTINLSQPIELYGIGDVQDTIEDGKIVRRFKEVVFDGSDDEPLYREDTPNGNHRFIIAINGNFKSENSAEVANAICNQLRVVSANETWFGTEGLSIAADLRIRVKKFNTVEEMKTHLQVNPITVFYEVKTPIIEPLPLVDQMALNSLKTYDGVTYVQIDSEIDPTVQFEYGSTKNGGRILEGLLAGRNGELLVERVAALEATLVNNI